MTALQLDAVRHAQAVYHLAAAEEYRICFSLTNIDSAVSAGKGWEIFLPGAHSDVGGCYRNGGGENKALWTDRGSEGLLDYLEAYGWAQNREAHIVGGWDVIEQLNDVRPMLPSGEGRKLKPMQAHLLKVDRYVKLERRNLSNRYSFIPLHLMAEFAREQGLNIPKEKVERDYDPTAAPGGMPPDMVRTIKAYAQRAKATRSSLAEDWQRRSPELNHLRNRFLHFSSGSEAGFNLRANVWADFLDPWRRVYSDTA